ncbi:muscle M-line assembly protein unc-89-like isoform X2 [Schistocerca serialis cubense]|uniref:muscle M-line assembly protein unc-89-like isoform X2 n=1 Tax=Schistocerca serialis cubense TaxID=2023355 RepID=UPI00214EB403|nr:muscle M-line assembly protein unc-89-like isoform X2 [Schistocerca serialis cubense]
MGHCLPPTCRSVPAESTRSDAITSSSEPKPGTLAVEGNSTKRGRRHSTLDLKMESDALLEMNQMELRSGRNLIKCAAADSMELAGTSISSKETIQTPVRKSFRTKRSIGREKENEEPGAPFISVENFPDRKSSQRKSNKRKSKWEEENEGMVVTSHLAENAQTPNSKSSLTKKRRKSMQILNEQPDTSVVSKETTQTPTRKFVHIKRSTEKENDEPAVSCFSVENSLDRKSSQRKTNKRKSKLEEENEGMAITSPLAENVQIPNSGMSLTKKRRKSMQIVNEQPGTPTISTETTQTPTRKSIHIKRSVGKEEQNYEPGTPTISTETTQTPTRKSIHIKRSVGKEEQNDEPDIPCILVEDSPDGKSGKRKTNKRSSKLEEQNEGTELSDLAPPLQECGTSSTHMTENVERNDELLVPTTDQNEEDIAEILNSTFEVAEQDSILQTPARKRSVRFAAAVETASFSSSVDSTPKFSTPVSVNSKQRSSHYKGTPHPSVKKRPASILKTSSSKKFPSSSKDTSLKGKGSARKMPDFNSIHKAQFEKMESIVDFSHRRQKCVRKLEDQAVDGNDKEIQLKPFAVVKPVEKRARNAVSRIPVAPQNTSRHGTPRALSSSHIPVASFHVLKEKNFDARLSAPHTINSRPSSAKMGNNSRPKPLNNLKPQRITYEQAKATIQNKKPLAAVKREAERLENRNILKGVRLNRRFELQMQHRKLNV